MNQSGGGKPLFLTCEVASVESFKAAGLSGQEGRLAPAAPSAIYDSRFTIYDSLR